jgi:hypothetical protein
MAVYICPTVCLPPSNTNHHDVLIGLIENWWFWINLKVKVKVKVIEKAALIYARIGSH